MFVGRVVRIVITLILIAGSITYAGIRLGWDTPRAAAATTPPTITMPRNAQLFGFQPARLTIKKGQDVRVINRDGMRHSVTSKARHGNGRCSRSDSSADTAARWPRRASRPVGIGSTASSTRR